MTSPARYARLPRCTSNSLNASKLLASNGLNTTHDAMASYAALRAADMTSRITVANTFRVIPSKTLSSSATSFAVEGVDSVSTSSPHASPCFKRFDLATAPGLSTFNLPSTTT